MFSFIEFVLTDPIYCQEAPSLPQPKLIDVGYYYNHRSLVVAQPPRSLYSPRLPRPRISNDPEYIRNYDANPPSDTYDTAPDYDLPYPIWSFKRPQAPRRRNRV